MERASRRREPSPADRPQARLSAAGAVVVAILILGCGSARKGNESTRAGVTTAPITTSAATSRASHNLTRSFRFIHTADAVCRRLNSELVLHRKTPKVSLVASTLRNAAVERRVVEQLSRLTPPAWMARDWQEMNADKRVLAQDLVRFAEYVRKHDARSRRALALSKLRMHKRLLRLASGDGFTACAQVGTSLKRPQAPASGLLSAFAASGGGR
jgi:hypothetical protein